MGTSDWSRVKSATPVDATPPDAPKLTLTATINSLGLDASWTEPAANGAPITGYWVRHREFDSEFWNERSVSGEDTSVMISVLHHTTLYEAQVRAVNAAGESEWSNVDYASTWLAYTPDAPGSVYLSPRDGSIRVQWTKPADNRAPCGGGVYAACSNRDLIHRYHLQYRVKGSSDWTTITIHPDNVPPQPTHDPDNPDPTGAPLPEWPSPLWVPTVPRARTIDGLTNGTTYELRVRAQIDTNNANGAWSDVMEESPSATPTAPPAPRDLTLTPNNNRITATWDAALSDNGDWVSDYDVEYRAQGAAEWTDGAHVGTPRTYTIEGLTKGTTYEVRVRGENSAGDGDWAVESVTLPAPYVPSQPVLLQTTMTVGTTGNLAGYSRYGTRDFGQLADTTFTLDEVDFTITELLTWGGGGVVCFRSAPMPSLLAMDRIKVTINEAWSFHRGWSVGGGGDVCQSHDGLTLTDGDWIAVVLEEMPPTEPGPSGLVVTPGDKQLTVTLPEDLPYTLKQAPVKRVTAWAIESHHEASMTGDSVTITGLHNCKLYSVRVRIVLANGNTVVLPDLGGTYATPNGTEIVAPRQPRLTPYNSMMGVYWTSGFTPECGITYDLDWSLWDDPWNSSPAVTGLTASHVLVGGLQNGVSYKFRVRAVRDGVATAWAPMSYSVPGADHCTYDYIHWPIMCTPNNLPVVGVGGLVTPGESPPPTSPGSSQPVTNPGLPLAPGAPELPAKDIPEEPDNGSGENPDPELPEPPPGGWPDRPDDGYGVPEDPSDPDPDPAPTPPAPAPPPDPK